MFHLTLEDYQISETSEEDREIYRAENCDTTNEKEETVN